jgi:PqqD family protein of HPr-rel-A system
VSKSCFVGLPKNGGVYCCFWDDECVVYHELSGRAHLIDEIGAFLFNIISKHTITKSQLLSDIITTFELPIDLDLENFLENLIVGYEALGLLEVTENS